VPGRGCPCALACDDVGKSRQRIYQTRSFYILFSHLHTFALQFEPILGGQTQSKSIKSTGESLQRALAA
jgi:hypothetical protein